jgi:hypothetical protein
MQEEHAVGAKNGVVRLVGGQEDGEAGRRQRLDAAQHQHLVAEVQAGGGLVHEQHAWLLGQGSGEEHELALAAPNPCPPSRRWPLTA